jgi:hypothetical protein
MENLLQAIPGVSVYVDDILVTGKTEAEQLEHLDEVLKRLEAAGMRIKLSKCAFMLSRVEYLSHGITNKGLQPTQEKVCAITNAPRPQNVT